MSTIPPLSDPRFDPDYGATDEPKKKRSPWVTCLIGCLVIVVVLLLLAAIIIYWITQNWRGWTAEGGSQVVKQMIANSTLPDQEKADINIQVDRLATAFRENRISMERGNQLMQNLAKSPLMTSFMVSAIEQAYFAKSGLSEEEKTAGRITLQRFVRGMVDDKIDEQGIDNAMAHVATKDAHGEWKVRQQLTDAELRAFLDAAKAEADKAGVPAEPEVVDPSDEFKRIVDEALAQPDAEANEMPGPLSEPVK